MVVRPQHLAARFLSSRLLVAIGKRSYALYLWSYVLNTWLRDTGAAEPYLVVATSFLAAEVSYRCVELPALRLKHHFETTRPTEQPSISVTPAAEDSPREPLEEKVLISR